MPKEYVMIRDYDVPLYRGKLIIVISNSIEKLKAKVPEFNRSRIYAHSFGINYKGRTGYAMILNFENDFAAMTHGCITHEAIHLAHFVADDKGFVADFNNDEPIAYLAEWITDKAYEFMKESKLLNQIKINKHVDKNINNTTEA